MSVDSWKNALVTNPEWIVTVEWNNCAPPRTFVPEKVIHTTDYGKQHVLLFDDVLILGNDVYPVSNIRAMEFTQSPFPYQGTGLLKVLLRNP